MLSNPAPASSQNPLSSLLPKHKPLPAALTTRPRHKPLDCDSSARDTKPCYAVSEVSVFDSPAVPDRGGNSVIGGLVRGLAEMNLDQALTAIEPNLEVCMRPMQASSQRLYCTLACPHGHSCLNKPFTERPVLDANKPIADVIVANVDQKTGAGHILANFTVEPTLCTMDQPCQEAVINKATYGPNATIRIGFATPWQCPDDNNPLGKDADWEYGKRLTTKYALVWTDYCAGITLDGIVFELRGGGAPNPPARPGTQARAPDPTCDPNKPNPNMMHIIQFVYTSCSQSAASCGSGYQVQAGARDFGRWYLDDGAQGVPCLVPDQLVAGVHVVNDEPSANLDNGTPMTKQFVDFVMRGTQVTEVIEWTRQGQKNPLQRLGRQLQSTYTLALEKNARTDVALGTLCTAKTVVDPKEQSNAMLAAVWTYMGCG